MGSRGQVGTFNSKWHAGTGWACTPLKIIGMRMCRVAVGAAPPVVWVRRPESGDASFATSCPTTSCGVCRSLLQSFPIYTLHLTLTKSDVGTVQEAVQDRQTFVLLARPPFLVGVLHTATKCLLRRAAPALDGSHLARAAPLTRLKPLCCGLERLTISPVRVDCVAHRTELVVTTCSGRPKSAPARS